MPVETMERVVVCVCVVCCGAECRTVGSRDEWCGGAVRGSRSTGSRQVMPQEEWEREEEREEEPQPRHAAKPAHEFM